MRTGVRLTYELIWWAFALILATLVVLPLYSTVPQFPYFLPNFVYVVVAVTLTRYLFFLKISWLRDRFYVQGALMFLLVPLVFWMVQYFNYFIIYFDEQGPDVLIRHLDTETGRIINGYVHAEYRFFGVWAIMASAVMPFRLLLNIWRRYQTTMVRR